MHVHVCVPAMCLSLMELSSLWELGMKSTSAKQMWLVWAMKRLTLNWAAYYQNVSVVMCSWEKSSKRYHLSSVVKHPYKQNEPAWNQSIMLQRNSAPKTQILICLYFIHSLSTHYLSSCRWKVRGSFIGHSTFQHLQSKAALQPSPKQLKHLMQSCFKCKK